MAKKRPVTVEEAILVHLLDYKRYFKEDTVPMKMTQAGISRALGVRRSHISTSLDNAKQKETIEESMAHIKGETRRRKCYFLTESGISIAKELKEKIARTEVFATLPDNNEFKGTLSELLECLDTSVTLPKVALLTFDGKTNIPSPSAESEMPIKGGDNVPEIRHFFGRERELAEMESFFSGDNRLLLVNGIPGIGKTALVAHAINNYSKFGDAFWFSVTDWSSPRNTANHLAAFFDARGFSRFKRYVTAHGVPDFADLRDTGGTNVWASQLGSQLIIYQTQGIWALNHVGGSTVFSPYPFIPDLGLLAPHLLVTKNNVHYFLGTDYNVYSYYGGTTKKVIGDKIHGYLQEELEVDYEARCWMGIGAKGKRLWLFIVPSGEAFITKAYSMDFRTGAWMKRDYANKWSDAGITAVSLVGAQQYTTGETYNVELNKLSLYDSADDTATTAGDTTLRYGDELMDGTENVLDWSVLAPDFSDGEYDFSWTAGEIDFSTGGLKMCFSYQGDPTALMQCITNHSDGTTYSGAMIRIDDGSDSDDMNNGGHFFTLSDVCSVDGGDDDWSVTVCEDRLRIVAFTERFSIMAMVIFWQLSGVFQK